MKAAFFIVLAVLLLSSVGMWAALRGADGATGDAPQIRWSTGVNPARAEQAAGFHRWLATNGHPPVDLVLEMGTDAIDKKIIQGVSGVGSDVADLFTAAQMHYFQRAGLLLDITDEAARLGIAPANTYPVTLPEITRRNARGELRQYTYPLNLGGFLYYANKETFERHSQPLPPRRWDIETFEHLGTAFVAAANRARVGDAGRIYYVDRVDPWALRRSLGGCAFNETMTRSALDDGPNRQALQLLRRWTYDLRLMPSAAEVAGMSSNASLFGQTLQLWHDGRFALAWSSRHLLVQARLFNLDRARRGVGPMRLTTVEPPHGGFPNTTILVRSAGVYAGTQRPDLVLLFLAYLASDEYNGQLVRDADALPPNPAILASEAYLRPAPDAAAGIFPETEWDVHGAFAEACLELGVASSYSPFVLRSVVDRIEAQWRERALADPPLCTIDEAAAGMARQIDAEIERTLSEDAALRDEYASAVRRQSQIDAHKARGEPVPVELIDNPFHLAFYRHGGRLASSPSR